MFCCGAEIVPMCFQCEHKPYPSYSLQRSLLISKDHIPKRGFVAISALIKVFRRNSDRFRILSDTECSTFNSGAEQYCSGAENARKQRFRSSIRYTFCDAPFHYPVQCEHSLRQGGEAMRYFCIVRTVIRWLLLLLLILTFIWLAAVSPT